MLLLATSAVSAQDAPLSVSVDCPGSVPGCDVDFFQTEVAFARFVRDPAGADVAVLITTQATGGGGQRYDLFFRGRRGAASGRVDTLTVQTEPGATDDAQRRALLGRLALGVAGFAARTSLADQLSVAYAAPAAAAATAPARDPWNNWVFRVSGQGSFNGEQRTSSANTFGSFSASRVTDRWKVSIRPNGSYNRRTFELRDGSTVVNENTSYGAFGRVVRALSPHWSAAMKAGVRRSTFQNYEGRFGGGPAVEYNVFPYTESTRRQLRLSAELEGEGVAYVDTTIFGKTSESNLRQEYGVAAVFAQPWGSTDIGLEASHILTRPDKYRFELNGQVDFRITRGLNVNVFGNASLIRDQINLPRVGATDEEVLTAQRELATGYQYFMGVGLSYTFGSIFNPVVNARFGN